MSGECKVAGALFSDYFLDLPSDLPRINYDESNWHYTPCDCFIWDEERVLFDTGTGGCVSSEWGRPVCKTEALNKLLLAPLRSDDEVRSLSFSLEVHLKTHHVTHLILFLLSP